jgi:TonB-linked SusC/RagA family outer membrane protein
MQLLVRGIVLRRATAKLLLIMKITTVLILAASLQVSARGISQTLTLKERNTPFEKVLKEITRQSGYDFFYRGELITQAKTVTVELKNMELKQALDLVFKDQPFTYAIANKTIVVSPKIPEEKKIDPSLTGGLYLQSLPPPNIDVTVTVLNSDGQALEGASITVKGMKKGVITDANGRVTLKAINDATVLVISFTGYQSQELKIDKRTAIGVRLVPSVSELDALQVIAYGTTTRRMNTGSVGHVSSEEIAKQPVVNPLQALQARVPGLIVTQTSGLGSASFNVQIRGQSSFAFASDPLFVIDGVPLMAGSGDAKSSFSGGDSKNLGLNQNFMVTGLTQSPLYSMNPADIESIEVLKDADATAIYGSQGANGVILINTKRGRPGKMRMDINVYSGAGNVTRMNEFLKTDQYLQIRREAFFNSNLAPTLSTAPDLLKWDQTRYTDWQKMLIGNTARTTDAQLGFSGGDEFTQYRVSGGFHNQTDVTTASGSDKRISGTASITTSSHDRKLRMGFTSSYSNTNTDLVPFDISLMVLPPNAPAAYDNLGRVNYSEWGSYANPGGALFGSLTNPFGALKQTYTAITENMQTNINLQYQPVNHFTLRVTGGYSSLQNSQLYLRPKASYDPATVPISSTLFGGNSVKTWIIEPQMEYNKIIGRGRLTALLGGTFQNTITKGLNGQASDFSNEALLRSINSAKTVVVYADTYTPYRYQAFFGRLNYAWANKYIVNLTARRDGSSRFGPGRQFGNFGAVGTAWIFSEEPFVKKAVPFLSFGKLRGSYGLTGSANVGDYNYLGRWTGNTYPYQSATLSPTQHLNPDYSWEENRKLEFGTELGFLKDRIQLQVSWFRNRSGNELVSEQLPVYTGFATVTNNLPALIQNMGWEFSLASTNFKRKDLNWTTTFNISIIRNKLLSYPDLATSPYALLYKIGQAMSVQRLLHFEGINPQTGAILFTDLNKDGKISSAGTSNDLVDVHDKAPSFYGGLNNAITYKNWQLSFFLQFTKQWGFQNRISLASVGTINNQPLEVLNRWQKPGDIAVVPKLTTTSTTDYTNYNNSDAALVDASFIRLQNLSLSYTLPAKWTGKYLPLYTRFFVQGQNLLTITKYKGADPETQGLTSVPPVRFLTAGLQITF